MFVTLAVLRIPSILFAAVLMLNSPRSLPLISEYLVLVFGDPNSSLSLTLSLTTSAPTTFSGTDAELWRNNVKNLQILKAEILEFLQLTNVAEKSGALSLLSITVMTAVQVDVSPSPSRSAASTTSLYSG